MREGGGRTGLHKLLMVNKTLCQGVSLNGTLHFSLKSLILLLTREYICAKKFPGMPRTKLGKINIKFSVTQN